MSIATVANAGDATLAKAIAAYNALPSKARVLAVAPTTVAPGARITQVPVWLTQVDLTEKEAAATAAAFGVYGDGYQLDYQTRRWGAGATAAGYVADAVLAPTAGLPDAMPNEPPAPDLTDGRRTALLGAMKDLGSCSGALVSAANKAASRRAGDDAKRLLIKARRDLGASALPPDNSCLG